MRKLIYLLFFLPFLGQAQEMKETTLFNYQLFVDEEFQADLKSLGENMEDFKDVMKNQDPLAAGIIDDVYANINEKLSTNTNIQLQAVSTLKESGGKKLAYAYGYPVSLKKRALTHKTASYYTSIKVEIYPRSGSITKTGLNNTYKSEKKKLRPFVRISMKLFDENGELIGKYVGKAKSKERVEIKTHTLFRWFQIGEKKRFEDGDNQTILDDTINTAIDNLILEINK